MKFLSTVLSSRLPSLWSQQKKPETGPRVSPVWKGSMSCPSISPLDLGTPAT